MKDLKLCSKCGQKPLANFSKDLTRADGLCVQCKECQRKHYQKNKGRIKAKHKEWSQVNAEKVKAYLSKYQREYRRANPDKIKASRDRDSNKTWKNAYMKQYYLDNVEKCKAHNREYYRAHHREHNARGMRRRAALLQRTPKWLTLEQEQQIKDFYLNCPPGYEVDHIIPLQGERVSGLHHPNNLQYLTTEENRVKGNQWSSTYNSHLSIGHRIHG